MSQTWPLVGRDDELRFVLDALGDDGGRGVVLVGPPGVGKTRLAQEAVAVARAQGVVTITINATPALSEIPPGQPHWRHCRRCETLAYRPGQCFAGGTHDLTGSSDYTLRLQAGQATWRHCKNCKGLWFSGNGGQGGCPSPAGVHDPGADDYIAPS